jgi:sensor histidine kinase YesM
MSLILWGLEKLCIHKKHKFGHQITLQFLFTLITLNIIPLFILSTKGLNNTLEVVVPLALSFTLLSFLRCAYIYFNHYSENLIKQKDVELSHLKELQAATELSSLHAQINPHFLYNALNSIASLAHINADKTEKMALSLSDLFRYSINRKGEKMSTIKEEVEMVENYLEIEKIRFEDRLEFSVNVEASILETNIPRFILQPLIENAVKHGTSNIEGKGNINLTITKNNNNLIISVSDNGPHFPDGLVSGHGLQSVYDLLRLSYGEQANMNWENSPKKKITITISSNS